VKAAFRSTGRARLKARGEPWPELTGAKRIVAFALAAAVLAALAGLVGYTRLNATDAGSPSPATVQAPVRDKHDVAVLSVDFDPPLGSAWPADKEPALLVAIDNRGTETESALAVQVSLTGDSQADVRAKLSEPISSLAPGEVKVVRFAGAANLPIRSSQWVIVEVAPTRDGAGFAKNTKAVRLDGLTAPRKD
jgi:hypothetical protein